MLVSAKELESFFEPKINKLNVSLSETRAYINGIYLEYTKNNIILNDPITIIYMEANEEGNFSKFQKLADWIFFIRTKYPKALKASPDYYDTIAKSSYHKCHIMMNGMWPVFNEMADKFTNFAEELMKIM